MRKLLNEEVASQACGFIGFRHPYLTLLSTSRAARSSDGYGEFPGGSRNDR